MHLLHVHGEQEGCIECWALLDCGSQFCLSRICCQAQLKAKFSKRSYLRDRWCNYHVQSNCLLESSVSLKFIFDWHRVHCDRTSNELTSRIHLWSQHLLQLKASWFAFLWIIEGRSIIRRRNILGFIVRRISGSHSSTQLYKKYTVRMDLNGSNRWFFKQSAESAVFSRNYKQRTDTRSVEPLLILGRTVSITWLVTPLWKFSASNTF